MKPGRTYIQLIPEKIYQNLSSISKQVESQIKGYSLDNLTEIISIIATHDRKDKDPIPLKMVYLKKLVPQGDKYIHALIKLRIVVRRGYAIKGQTSFKYEFANELKSAYRPVPLINPKLIRRIELVQKSLSTKMGRSKKIGVKQVKNLKQLELDHTYRDLLDSSISIPTERRNSILASAIRIENGDIFFNVDNTSQRFHSNVTNMPKELRPYLRVKGYSLVNINIKNSQPYLSTLILTNPTKISRLANNADFAMLLQSLHVSHNADVNRYVSLVVSGQLYEYMMDEFAKVGLNLSRNDTKRQILKILFAKNKMPKEPISKLARETFVSLFPSVDRIFSQVRGSNKGDSFTNFKRFSILMQRVFNVGFNRTHLWVKTATT